jgi:hypothetical protein
MTPEAAVVRISETVSRMNELYGRPVFDEWALLAVAGNRACVLAYEGPRRAGFVQGLSGDLVPLRAELDGMARDPGAFRFAREADGTRVDACIVAGHAIYALFNATNSCVSRIVEDVRWRRAQSPFASLAERFGLDPVSHPSAAAVPVEA